MPKRVIISADDFGLSEGVNEAVERAHRDGILSTTSLMVAGPAAADAIRRARAMPDLRVGLHLVVIEGDAIRPDLAPVGPDDRFGSDQFLLGIDYFFRPTVRRRLAAEIRAQFEAFAATGLRLDHANAHKHMHLHPTVSAMLIRIGQEFGLRAIRVPAEPPGIMLACGTGQGIGARALYAWTRLLRWQAETAGLLTNDHAFGIAWSGHMTSSRLTRLAAHLPDGLTEIYFHPAVARDADLVRLMPNYEHEAEFATLTDPLVRAALADAGAVLVGY